jgi:hypothetical protein
MLVTLTARHFADLCAVTGLAEVFTELERLLGADFGTDADRYRHREAIAALIEPWFAARSLDEVSAALGGCSVLWSPYRTFTEAARSATANPMMTELDQPGVGEAEMAAGRHGLPETGDDLVRILLAGDEVEDGREQDRDRAVQIDEAEHVGVVENLFRPSQIRTHDPYVVGGLEQRVRMGDDDRVVVDVHHAGLRRDRGGHLVDIALRRQPGPDVDDLVDAGLSGEEAHGAADEAPVLPGHQASLWGDRQDLLRRLAIRGEVVLAAEVVVVHPGDVGNAHVDSWRSVPPVRRQTPVPRSGGMSDRCREDSNRMFVDLLRERCGHDPANAGSTSSESSPRWGWTCPASSSGTPGTPPTSAI